MIPFFGGKPLEIVTMVRFNAMAQDKFDAQRVAEPGVDHFCFQYVNLTENGRAIQKKHMREALLALAGAYISGGATFSAVLRKIANDT